MAIDQLGRRIHYLRISLTLLRLFTGLGFDKVRLTGGELTLRAPMIIWIKPWGHGLERGIIPVNRVMSEIGG